MQKAADFIKQFVKFSAVPYKDKRGNLAIGYGSTINVNGASTCVEADANQRLLSSVAQANALIKKYITKQLSQNERIALTSLFVDVGYEDIRNTELIAHINAGKYVLAGHVWQSLNKVNRTVSIFATKRRQAEYKLFMEK